MNTKLKQNIWEFVVGLLLLVIVRDVKSHENMAQAQLLVNTVLLTTDQVIHTGFIVRYGEGRYLLSALQLGQEAEKGKKIKIHSPLPEQGEIESGGSSLIGTSQKYGASVFKPPEGLNTKLNLSVTSHSNLGQYVQWFGLAKDSRIWLTEGGQIISFQLPKKWKERGWDGLTVAGRGRSGLVGAPVVIQDLRGATEDVRKGARVFGMIRAYDLDDGFLAVSPVSDIIKSIVKGKTGGSSE